MKPQYFDNVYKIQCLRGLDCRSDDGPCKKLFGNSYLPIVPPPPGRYPYNGNISCQLQTLQAMVYQLFDTNL